MAQSYPSHLDELEQRFSQLEPRIPASPEKEAISLLHALLLEYHRDSGGTNFSGGKNHTHDGAHAFERVANLYKHAPGMSGPAVNEGLPPGSPAPDFILPDGSGQPVRLSEYRGRQVLLVFYPLDWSPACSDQLSLYQSELEEFKRLDTAVLAVSVDSLYSHGAWAAVRGITFPLLSDFAPHGEIARRYKVFREREGFSERALFVIDNAGIVRYRSISPELPKIPDIYELFAALRDLTVSPARKG